MDKSYCDTILDNSPIGYCIISHDLKINYINPKLLKYLELTHEQIRDYLWIQILIEKNYLRNKEKSFRRWLRIKMNPNVGSSKLIAFIFDDLRTEFFVQIDPISDSEDKLVTVYPVSGTILLHHSRMSSKVSHEYEIASKIQRNMNDFIIDVIEGRYFKYHFTRLFLPSGILSGDIVNIKTVSRRYSSLFLGDGRGHGLPAALYSSLINSYLNIMAANVPHGIDTPARLISDINIHAYRDFTGSGEYYFFSGVYGLIDGNTRDMMICNAGHPYPAFIRDRNVTRLRTNGPLVGIFEDSTFTEEKIQLEDGDTFLFFTDGFYDILPPNNPGEEHDGISELILDYLADKKNHPKNVFDFLKTTIQNFNLKHDINDDITLLQMYVEEKKINQ